MLNRFQSPRFMKNVLLVLIFCQVVNISLDTYSIYDRRQIHREARVSRQMLDARARIQIIVVKVLWNQFSTEEKQFIEANWQTAEYEQALPIENK